MSQYRQTVAFAVSLSLCLIFLASNTWSSSVGTEGASFLDIPVGAGPAALGGSYVARAADVYGTVWNPAGLGRMHGVEVTGQHLDYLESIHYEFAGLAVSLRPGSTLGAGVQYLGSGDIQGMDNFGTPTAAFSSHYAAYSIAFGQRLGDTFSLGVTGKYIEAKLNDVHANAFAGDVGGLFRPTERLAFGAALVNLGSPLSFINQRDPLPMAFRAGVLINPWRHWNFSLDGDYRRTGMASAHTGIEWRPISSLSLRVGYRTDTLKDLSPLAGFSTGIGVDIMGHELAYAWVPMGELGNVQYFSFKMRFGEAQKARENLVYLSHSYRHRAIEDMSVTLKEVDQ